MRDSTYCKQRYCIYGDVLVFIFFIYFFIIIFSYILCHRLRVAKLDSLNRELGDDINGGAGKGFNYHSGFLFLYV